MRIAVIHSNTDKSWVVELPESFFSQVLNPKTIYQWASPQAESGESGAQKSEAIPPHHTKMVPGCPSRK